jgi:hypothetical protein
VEAKLSSITHYYSAIKEGKIDSTSILKKYAMTEYFEEAIAELEKFINLEELAALLAWLEDNLESYKLKEFTLLKDLEFNEPLTVAIHIKSCGFKEWESIVKSIKQKIIEEGFIDLVGRITIVCIDVFRPREHLV